MRNFLLAAGLALPLAVLPVVVNAAGDDDGIQRSGNWNKKPADAGASGSASKKSKAQSKQQAEVPLPRAKPGSKAAKREAEETKKVRVTETKKQPAEADVPVPRKKQKPKAAVQAGLAPATDGGSTSAPFRGSLDSGEIKQALAGKVLASRIEGNDARITLSDDGSLSWTSSAGSGQGRWWTEKGRVCDRYDPAGGFPGRGAGCRSFEQKPDGYYSGGRKLQFLN